MNFKSNLLQRINHRKKTLTIENAMKILIGLNKCDMWFDKNNMYCCEICTKTQTNNNSSYKLTSTRKIPSKQGSLDRRISLPFGALKLLLQQCLQRTCWLWYKWNIKEKQTKNWRGRNVIIKKPCRMQKIYILGMTMYEYVLRIIFIELGKRRKVSFFNIWCL